MKVDKIFRVSYKYHPKSKEELINAIKAEIEKRGPKANLNCIDTSEITDMSSLFNSYYHEYAGKFNGDISGWDVSNVINMDHMFCGVKNFNRDISGWDVSNVVDMEYMFCRARSFNQDISNWDISNVKYMEDMFNGCQIKEEYKPKFSI